MTINVSDNINTINLQQIYDFLKMLKTEMECANDICKKIDDWSYWLPNNINEIKDELWGKRKHIEEFMEEIKTTMLQRKNIYLDFEKYLASEQETKAVI